MFNGIIRNTGRVIKINKTNKNFFLSVKTKIKFSQKEIGASISCSGACLTIEKIKKNIISFYISKESLSRTNFKFLKVGDILNLERSLKFGDRISGHFVQGHVDTTASIRKIILIGKSWIIKFNLSKKFKNFIIEKGSIAINGVSLTISKVLTNGFEISVIPQTLKLTNLNTINEKDVVNIEFDFIGKYIKKFLKDKK